jgi:hypothetical protein
MIYVDVFARGNDVRCKIGSAMASKRRYRSCSRSGRVCPDMLSYIHNSNGKWQNDARKRQKMLDAVEIFEFQIAIGASTQACDRSMPYPRDGLLMYM